MQIQISAEQVEWVRRWLLEPLFIPFVIWGFKQLRKKINQFITDNVNRIRDELMEHVDKKINDHEQIELHFFQKFEAEMKERHVENQAKLEILTKK